MSQSERLLNMLSPDRLKEVGAIAVLAGSIEFRLERVLWKLNEETVTGHKPSTDTKPISVLIDNLGRFSEKLSVPELKAILNLWTRIAKPAFKCRNSILHGLAIVYSESDAEFITNTQWEGEIRKRDSSSFHVNERTLILLSSIFQTLLDSIAAIQDSLYNDFCLTSFFSKEYLSSMSEQLSVANEIVDLAAAVNHEKY